MLRALLDLLFPRACAACGRRPVEGSFCRDCAAFLETPPAFRCGLCAEPLLTSRASRCEACVASPPPFERVFSPFVHGGAIAQAIHRYKYRGRRELARQLAPLLAAPAAGLLATADVVAPIPLHPSRRRQRGYDQAALLAREVALQAGRPFAGRLLRRDVDTQRQVGLQRQERERNVAGAFSASPAASGLVIALIDDVVTTSSTSRAAALALKEAGARQVLVLALARAGT